MTRLKEELYFQNEKESIDQKLEQAIQRLNKAILEYDPIAVFGLFSGGHDSFSSSWVSSLGKKLDGVLHINTGIGIEATREYVRETCKNRNWNLLEYKATENIQANGTPDPQIYEDFVRKHGFPGAHGHGMMYQRLKQRQLQRVERDFGANCRGKKKLRVMYVSGCRSQESQRRMANTQEVQVDGRRIWCAPIHDFSKLDTTNTLEIAAQPRNQVVDLIHKSGECLCGAYAKKGELEELKLWDITRPAYDRIVKLQAEVKGKFGYGWEGQPKARTKCTKSTEFLTTPGPLCWSCDKDGNT